MKNQGKAPFSVMMSRKQFLKISALSAAAVASGCAINPVSGERQLMLVSKQQEINIDRQNSPHQFSADYGSVQDRELNAYITDVGNRLIPQTHRLEMPYSFRVVNATYVNAYAFPGGSIAATRGIMLELGSEAELAGLLGHELGHINARHTAQRMTKGIATMVVLAGITEALRQERPEYANLAAGLGQIGAGALLAHYSRDNEREADALGLEYTVKADYSPRGFVDLMEMLQSLSKHKPSKVQMLFSTHPMSSERYQTAVNAVRAKYPEDDRRNMYRERYMDSIARLRSIEPAINEMQAGEGEMYRNQLKKAEDHLQKALKIAPGDYTALVMMAKCQLALENLRSAKRYAARAQDIYPQEAQAHHISGMAHLLDSSFQRAYMNFDSYESRLSGNPNTIFLKGLSREGMADTQEAAEEYYRYLQQVNQGEAAEYAYGRLVEWGYIDPQQNQ